MHHARGVELHHFRVFKGHAGAQGRCHAVAGGNVGGRGAVPENAGVTAGGQHHGLGAYRGYFARADVAQHRALATAIVHGHVEQLVIHKELDAVAQGVVQTGVGNNVAGFVGRVVAAHLGSAAKGPGLNLALGRARKGHAKIIELQNGRASLFAEFERGCLINKVIAALDRIKAVQLIRVALAEVGNAVDAALGHTGGTARGHTLADHNHVEFGVLF